MQVQGCKKCALNQVYSLHFIVRFTLMDLSRKGQINA